MNAPTRVGGIEKAPTGIPGIDEITGGGIPRGRVTLLIGGPGAGKTVLALETLVNGARKYGEPGVFVAFEENSRQIVQNAATFGWDLPALERERLFFLDARLSPSVVHAGNFDLNSMLAALDAKIVAMGAKRVVFDGVDVLLTLLDDPRAERREVYRIYDWLQERQITAILTAKADETDRLTTERYAFMQFMVDCMVVLQHRFVNRVSLRSLRVRKYRGTAFSENEYPLVIGPRGVEISTFGGAEIQHQASEERITTGIPRLDTMLGGGYYRGSSVLVSGVPGTAKTTLAGAFVASACAAGERALFVSFDEAADQIVRNLKSVGLDLGEYVEQGLLDMYSVRTESRGAEEHLLDLRHRLDALQPAVLVLDPISALAKTGGGVAASHASLRLLDLAKSRGITTLCTTLTAGADPEAEATAMQISTIADTWIHLSYVAQGGERNRTLTVIKSRGTRHSNQVRELVLGDDGVGLADVYTAGGEVLVGTARWEKEAEVRDTERRRRSEAERKRRELELVEAEVEAQIAALQRQLESKRAELETAVQTEQGREERQSLRAGELLRLRKADVGTTSQAAGAPHIAPGHTHDDGESSAVGSADRH